MRRKSKLNSIVDLIYRSFDTKLSQDESEKLKKAIESNADIKMELEQIQTMRSLVQEQNEVRFEPLFADRVLFRLSENQEGFFTDLLWSFRRVAILCAAVILFLMVNNFIASGEFSLDSALGLPKLTLEETISLNQFTGGD
jgi:hypothetical protein